MKTFRVFLKSGNTFDIEAEGLNSKAGIVGETIFSNT